MPYDTKRTITRWGGVEDSEVLMDACERRGLSTTMTKEQLQARLLEHDIDQVHADFSDRAGELEGAAVEVKQEVLNAYKDCIETASASLNKLRIQEQDILNERLENTPKNLTELFGLLRKVLGLVPIYQRRKRKDGDQMLDETGVDVSYDPRDYKKPARVFLKVSIVESLCS